MKLYSWQFNDVAWLYVASVVVALLVAYKSWRMRPARGAKEFALLSVSVSVWCLGYLLGFFNPDLTWKLIFLRVEYTGIISSSYFWLVFIGTYVNNEILMKPKTLAALAVIPIISFVLVLTITSQHIFYASYGLRKIGDLETLRKSYAAGFYVQTIYSYLLVIGGTLLLLRAVYQMPGQYRRQFVPITLAMIVILVPNFLYVARTGILGVYDPTPVSFALAGIMFSFAIVRYRFLDVVPTAYNQVFRDVNSGIIIIDERSRVLDLNPSAEKILSQTSRQLLGKSLSEFCPEIGGLLASSRNYGGKMELQLGTDKRVYSVTVSPLRNAGGHSQGGIVMLYEITELRNALDEIDTFAHTVAHDLKTPLSLLAGFSDLLSTERLTDPERAEAVDVIRVYSNKMVSIVDELLTLASVRRQQNVRLEPLDMSPIVKSALLRLERFAQEKKSKIFHSEQWPSSVGYAPWVEEVWVNYLSNALKYGGPSPVIYLGAEEQDGFIRFWVKDSGPGLSKTDQDKLFKEFSRLAREEDEAGHGLGLFIVSRILAKLGGSAGVESEPGGGSKFYFTLPKVSVESPSGT